MKFYLKVLKKNKVIFRTVDMESLTLKDIETFVDTFKTTIKKDCEIILHEVIVRDGLELSSWKKKFKTNMKNLFSGKQAS